MTSFEALSVVLSCLAVLVSLVVWTGQRKLQREANELQRVTADLSKKQLQLLKEQEHTKFVARLSLALIKDGKGYKLILSNRSSADALSVDLVPRNSTDEEGFLIESELRDKFPLKRLRAGDEVSLIAAVSLGSPTVSDFHVTWQNADGSTGIEEFQVSL